MLRSMLSVPYFEKALYEMPEAELSVASIEALADRIENEIQGGLAQRPLLSVPHIISDEASCYYHGYVLAEMSVHQTRQHFLKDGGVIVDNPEVGKALTSSYWIPGNSEMFLDLVEKLTGEPLTGKAWLEGLGEDLEAKVVSERTEYDAAIKAVAAAGAGAGAAGAAGADIDLSMRILIKDGDELIADTDTAGGFLPACKAFEDHVTKRFLV